ncbi:hypothetical protein ABD07_06465 [Nitrosomonas oligotropha]|nr:hypothetical protein [Nitrosomonas oligotropha]
MSVQWFPASLVIIELNVFTAAFFAALFQNETKHPSHRVPLPLQFLFTDVPQLFEMNCLMPYLPLRNFVFAYE